jgi:hypothetical protein
MEHRWGNRIELQLPVMIVTESGQRGFGLLRNFSSSGAYIETTLPLSPLTLIEVALHSPVGSSNQGLSLSGFVVRRDPCGLGIEWSDVAGIAASDVIRSRLPARLTA